MKNVTDNYSGEVNHRGLQIDRTHLWRWLDARFADKIILMNARRQIENFCRNSTVELAVLGCEMSLLPTYCNSLDFSILIQQSKDKPALPSDSVLDALFSKVTEKDLATSIWAEFDYPYTDMPLLYFSLDGTRNTETDTNKIADLYHEIKHIVVEFWGHYDIGSEWPSITKIKDWLRKLPEGELQQFGLSFREKKIQPRVLIRPYNIDKFGGMLDVATSKILKPVMTNGQSLLAFAYPFDPISFFGWEVISDQMTKANLRDLRQPPRIIGSRWLQTLKELVKLLDSNCLSMKTIKELVLLEHRCSQQIIDDDMMTQLVDLSGWNHYKLVLQELQVKSIKLYGGTIRNQFKCIIPDAKLTRI